MTNLLFSREIQTLKDSNRDLESKFTQRITKYMELKRQLINLTSKESMNTRVMEYVIKFVKYYNFILKGQNISIPKNWNKLEIIWAVIYLSF